METIIILLFILWLLGLAANVGNLVHVLLLIAVLLFVVEMVNQS